jgi:hypothetical protein
VAVNSRRWRRRWSIVATTVEHEHDLTPTRRLYWNFNLAGLRDDGAVMATIEIPWAHDLSGEVKALVLASRPCVRRASWGMITLDWARDVARVSRTTVTRDVMRLRWLCPRRATPAA